jgi:hypothetical protein
MGCWRGGDAQAGDLEHLRGCQEAQFDKSSRPAASNDRFEVARQHAQRRFPLSFLRPGSTALCVFGGFTKGRTDLVHLLEAGIEDVEVVEINSSRLSFVASIFPSRWRYTRGAPLDICVSRLTQGQSFDLTIADGSRVTLDHLWEDLFPYLMSLTRGFAFLRISRSYLEEYDLAPSSKAIVELVARLHGSRAGRIELVRRSSRDGGTYWAVIKGESSRSSKSLRKINTSISNLFRVPSTSVLNDGACVFMEDRFGAGQCAQLSDCAAEVNSLRESVLGHEHSGVFRAYTSKRFLALPRGRIATRRKAAAILDLDRFVSGDDLWESLRNSTSKKGTITRKISRAERSGYFVREFNPKSYVQDIFEINHSKITRAGKPMRESYLKTIEEMGGVPNRFCEPEPVACTEHNCTVWGVFKPEPGREIASVQTHDRLLGYIYLRRCGNLARYSRILGHGSHLCDGIMYLLHFRLIELLIKNRASELRYVQYTGMFSRGEDSGLHMWKRHCLFEPKYLIYDDAGDWRGPDGIRLVSTELSAHPIP